MFQLDRVRVFVVFLGSKRLSAGLSWRGCARLAGPAGSAIPISAERSKAISISCYAACMPLLILSFVLSFFIVRLSSTVKQSTFSMNGLRGQARERFVSEQKFRQDADLQKATIAFIIIAKFVTAETTVKFTEVQWSQSRNICDTINAPIPDSENEKATATMRIIRFECDEDGVICVDQRTFMEVFDDFGFDTYWLNLILCSTYGSSPNANKAALCILATCIQCRTRSCGPTTLIQSSPKSCLYHENTLSIRNKSSGASYKL